MNRNQSGSSRWLRLLVAVACLSAVGGVVSADEPQSDRGRVESMTPAQKHELAQRRQRFAALDPDEQDQLRRLHNQIEQDPNSPELRRVMSRYYEWLKTLPPYLRAELAELSIADRVERIRKIRDEERRQQAKRLSPADTEVLHKWMESIAARHEDKIIGALPEPMRQRVDSLKGPMRQRAIMGALWMRWYSAGSGKTPPIPQRDLAELRSKLSASVRGSLESLSPTDQWRMVSGWIRQASRHRSFGRRPRHGDPSKGDPSKGDPSKADEELAQFFEHELNAKQRDRLLGLPAEQMQQELWRMYMFWQKGSDASPWRPGDPRRGKPHSFDHRHGPPRFMREDPPGHQPHDRPSKPKGEKRKDPSGRRKPGKGR